MGKRRFWFDYNKPESAKAGRNILTVHYKDVCHRVEGIECNVPVETHDKNQQPRCVLRGWCDSMEIKNNRAIIN